MQKGAAMSGKQTRYDPELQMFAQEPREPRLERLRFLRWLAERGQLEHAVYGPEGGEYAAWERDAAPLVAAG